MRYTRGQNVLEEIFYIPSDLFTNLYAGLFITGEYVNLKPAGIEPLA